MRNAVSGALAACAAIALSSTAFAQSTNQYDYNANFGGATTVAPSTTYVQPATYGNGSTSYQSNYATSSNPTPVSSYPSTGTTSYTQPSQGYTSQTAQPVTSYTDTGTSYVSPSTSQSTYAAPTANQSIYAAPTTSTAATLPNYAAPTSTYSTATQGYGSTPQGYTGTGITTPSYAAQSGYGAPIYSQPMPTPGPATGYATGLPTTSYPSPVPATAYTPTPTTTPAAGAIPPIGDVVQDDDRWSMSLARYYPAIQACLRRSTVKNPVVANVQESGNQTIMLIGEGGASSHSVCKTGLTGTTIKAGSDVRSAPPVFFAPLGSTFTVSPDRPFQPVVDTNQKVIGWLVRTQPARVPFGQYGTAAGFDGQFIPPMMVNTAVGQG